MNEIALHFGFNVSLLDRYVAASRRGLANATAEALAARRHATATGAPWDVAMARMADWCAQEALAELLEAEEALALAEVRARTVRDRRPVPQV